MTDHKHRDAIVAALRAAFTDTDCTLTNLDVKQLVDAEWRAQMDRAMRQQFADRDA